MDYVVCKQRPGIHLAIGTLITIALLETAEILRGRVAQQLVEGSLAPHARVVPGTGDAADVMLVAPYACTCWGAELDEDDVIAHIGIDGPQTEDEKRAIGELLLAGKLHDLLAPASPDAVEGDGDGGAGAKPEKKTRKPRPPKPPKTPPPPPADGDVAGEAKPAQPGDGVPALG